MWGIVAQKGEREGGKKERKGEKERKRVELVISMRVPSFFEITDQPPSSMGGSGWSRSVQNRLLNFRSSRPTNFTILEFPHKLLPTILLSFEQ
jgi:hypothetical protein